MNNRKNSNPFVLYLLLFISLFCFVSCDIIDEILGNDDDNPTLTNDQINGYNSLVSVQDSASAITDNLFMAGLDTTAVMDSLYNFFINDSTVNDAFTTREGVGVEYKSGMVGGIYLGRVFLPDTSGLIPPDTSEIIGRMLSRSNNQLSKYPKIRKSIYFDASYSEFKQYTELSISSANQSLSQIDVEPFVKYLDYKATIDVLSTLDQYGFVHISGHGFYYSKDGYGQEGEAYLLTGNVPQLDQTYGTLWQNILNKEIIILKYHYSGQNRYWVSPKFISDRNNFSGNNTFIYSGICYGKQGSWNDELVIKAGCESFVGYRYDVPLPWESIMYRALYKLMCDTSMTNPKTLKSAMTDIVFAPCGEPNVIEGYCGITRTYFYGKPKKLFMKYKGNPDLTFWDNVPSTLHIGMKIDQANLETVHTNGSPTTIENNVDHYLGTPTFTITPTYLNDGLVEASLYYNEGYSHSIEYIGDITYKVVEDPACINFDLDLIVKHPAGEIEYHQLQCDSIPFYSDPSSIYPDNITPYIAADSSLSQYVNSYTFKSDAYIGDNISQTTTLINYSFSNDAWLSVEIGN